MANGLQKAIDLAFRCNATGNLIGWGTLACFILGVIGGGVGLFIPCYLAGIFVLPVLVPAILIVNLGVAIALVVSRLKHGSLPRFDKPRNYFIKGAISAALFYLGSTLFGLLYISFMTAGSAD